MLTGKCNEGMAHSSASMRREVKSARHIFIPSTAPALECAESFRQSAVIRHINGIASMA
jgi:hypothetical protein